MISPITYPLTRPLTYPLTVPLGSVVGRPSLLPQTKALIAAMAVAPSIARQRQIDTLMRGLVSAGIFQSSDLLYLLNMAVPGNSQPARLNVIAPGTNTVTEVNGPTWTPNSGVKGDGISQYLDSGLQCNAATYFKEGNASVTWVAASAEQQANSEVGSTGGNNAACNSRDGSNRMSGRIASSTSVFAGGQGDARGVCTVTRLGTTLSLYKNGVLLNSGNATNAPLAGNKFSILLSFSSSYSSRLVGGYVRFGGGITDAQVAAEHAAVRTWCNAVSPGLLP